MHEIGVGHNHPTMQAASARWHHHVILALYRSVVFSFLSQHSVLRDIHGYLIWLFPAALTATWTEAGRRRVRVGRVVVVRIAVVVDIGEVRHAVRRRTPHVGTGRGCIINRKRPVSFTPYGVSDLVLSVSILLERFHALSNSHSLSINSSATFSLSTLTLGISFAIRRIS